MPCRTRLIGAFILMGWGCVGRVGDPGPVPPRGDRPPAPVPPPGNEGRGGSGPEPAPQCAPGQAAAWHPAILTREQYINAASELVGFDVRPLVRFSEAGGRKFLAGVSLSALELEQRAATAEAIAAAATTPATLAALAPCDPAKPADACIDQLIQRLGLRAFRRPLSAATALALRQLLDAGRAAGGLAGGVEWLLGGLLQAPDFLYQLAPKVTGAPGAAVALDGHTLASRLAFFLWNSGPDDELLATAGKGGLGSPGTIAAQVDRMLADPRARRTREDYYAGWLKLETLSSATRDAPEFNAGLAATLARSVLEGVHEVYRQGAHVEALLGTSTLFLDATLAKVYGLPPPAGTGLQAVAASAEQRRGLLTHPALLANLASAEGSDPIKRGVFVTEALLCLSLPDPAANIPDLPAPRPGLSMRQRLEQHRAAPACASCHQLFDPVGLALENYDSIGRYRQTDEGVPIDSSADVQQGTDLDGHYADGQAWLARLPTSAAVRDCMVQRWLEYALRRDLGPGDTCAAAAIQRQFRERGDLTALLASIATSGPFSTVLADTGAMP